MSKKGPQGIHLKHKHLQHVSVHCARTRYSIQTESISKEFGTPLARSSQGKILLHGFSRQHVPIIVKKLRNMSNNKEILCTR